MNLARSLLILIACVAACTMPSPNTAIPVAQPDSLPVRNVTSFDGALHCMDRLFRKAGRSRLLMSSSGFPDHTKLINVSADDMLIGAISAMNRHSGAFAFIDQGHEVASGQITYLTRESRLKPKLYVRGAISQFDKDTVTATDSAGWGSSTSTALTGTLRSFNISRKRVLSVVTVDMHLVSMPGKIVLPGMSVSNSMVVVQRSTSGSAYGVVALAPLNLGLSISRIESKGQAVRNLIELGAIELLGRYTNLPYWECLTGTTGEVRQAASIETADTSAPDASTAYATAPILLGIARVGAKPKNAGDTLRVRITTSRDAYVSCYHSAKPGEIMRIFPIKSGNAGIVRRNTPLTLPQPQDGFAIEMTETDAERIFCIGEATNLRADYPASLRHPGLTRIELKTFGQVLGAHSNVADPARGHALVSFSVGDG